ncbi:unnamed protein product, partial [Mesorhabditis spiculigera]
MRVFSVPWIHHEGDTFYSIDISPVTGKIATSGPDGIKGAVRIWNSYAIGREDENPRPPMMLSSLEFDKHVNCVRWSRDGQQLVCGDDAHVVSVWTFAGGLQSAGTIGKRQALLERYERRHVMNFHRMEVSAVEWSTCERYMASASIDGLVVIWNARSLPDRVAVLDRKAEGHTGCVKGLSWDPIGTYLCTHSNDKTLKVWRTETWKLDVTIKTHFEENIPSMFSRPDWTPDGSFMVVPNGCNQLMPSCEIITRGDWDKPRSFIGHRKPINLVALGSMDQTLTLWAIPWTTRPLVNLQSIATQSIIDLAYCLSDLYVVSKDGRLIVVKLGSAEFGDMFTLDDMAETCQKLYKKVPPRYAEMAATPKIVRQDHFEASALRSSAVSQLSAERMDIGDVSMMSDGNTMPGRDKQINTKDEKGRRRVQPVFMASLNAAPLGPTTFAIPSPRKLPTSPVKRIEKMEVDNTIVSKSVARPASPESARPPKRKRIISETDESEQEEEISAPIKPHFDKSAILAADFKKPVLRVLEAPGPLRAVDGALTIPDVKKTLTEKFAPNEVLEVENDSLVSALAGKGARIARIQNGTTKWTRYAVQTVVVVASNKQYVVTGGIDRDIQILNADTGRLLRNVTIDAVPVRVGVQKHFVFALTASGTFHSWNARDLVRMLDRVPVLHLIRGDDPTISSVTLSESGTPLIGLSTGHLYSYDAGDWLLIDRGPSVLTRCFGGIPAGEFRAGVIANRLKKRLNTDLAPDVPAHRRDLCKQAALEDMMNGLRNLGTANDYKDVCKLYVRLLLQKRSEGKLQELIDELRRFPRTDGTLSEVQDMLKGDKHFAYLAEPSPKLPRTLF